MHAQTASFADSSSAKPDRVGGEHTWWWWQWRRGQKVSTITCVPCCAALFGVVDRPVRLFTDTAAVALPALLALPPRQPRGPT
jgi:hypothetical protein